METTTPCSPPRQFKPGDEVYFISLQDKYPLGVVQRVELGGDGLVHIVYTTWDAACPGGCAGQTMGDYAYQLALVALSGDITHLLDGVI